jgi:hypothetical protein
MADRLDIVQDLNYVMDRAPLPLLGELAQEFELPLSFDNQVTTEEEIYNNTNVLVDAIVEARCIGRVVLSMIDFAPSLDKFLSNELRASVADYRKTLAGMYLIL